MNKKSQLAHVEASAMQIFTISRLQEWVRQLTGPTFVAGGKKKKEKKPQHFQTKWSQSHFQKVFKKNHSNVRRLFKHDRVFWILRYVFYSG